MISLEQVQLLETRVGNAIDILKRVKAENASLVQEKNGLLSKLEANQKRLDELEVLVMRFKEDQGRIEDGIIAALDRLSQFEEAFESGLKDSVTPKKSQIKKTNSDAPAQEIKKTESKSAETKTTENKNAKEFFEITEEEKAEADLSDDFSLDNDNEENEDEVPTGKETAPATQFPASNEADDGELDIF